MDEELKSKWLTALRSNAYKQGRECLRNTNDNSYCCLGVLCDVSGMGKWKSGLYCYDDTQNSAVPPLAMLEDIQLNDADISVLVDMNDNRLTFEEIADYIEKNV